MVTHRLLIPGPVDIEDEVLAALASPTVPHYGTAWAEQYHEVVSGLKHLFGTEGDVYPIVGSGSTGLDSMIASFVATGKRMAIVRNGYFGDRMAIIAHSYGVNVHDINGEWGRAITVDTVRQALNEHGPFDVLGVVYAETSTGALNPLPELSALAKEFGIPILVDAITGFAGTPLELDAWNIDMCVSASQKAMAAPAGLAFVAVSAKGWEYMDANPVGPRGWILDVRTWRKYAKDAPGFHPQPATMPTGLMAAVNVRLRQIHAIGKAEYVAKHVRAASRFRSGLKSMGLNYLVPDAEATPQVTPVIVPDGRDANAIITNLRERYGFMATGGMGVLGGKIIRIGHMGKANNDDYIDDALEAFADICN
jgi:alanine-glyoxylate transaminase/serine-glyoxylate transaminase/serine-pyruvate transaminase